jgi:hypothetical protein
MTFENNENNQQPQENQYKLQLGISTKNFTQKPNPTEIRKIQFRKESITVNEMANLIKEGYCFSHNFNTQQQVYGLHEKTINAFDYTNYLWLDIDNSAHNLESFYHQLNHKPTIAYTTLSNTDQNYRYRLIYLLDFSITSNEEYKTYLNVIVNDIVNDLGNHFIQFIDRKCFNVSLMMYGSKKDCTLIQNDKCIYTNQMIEQIKSKLESNQSTFKFKDLIGLNELKCSKEFILNKVIEENTITDNGYSTTSHLCNQVIENYNNGFNYQDYLSNVNTIKIESEELYIDVSDLFIYELNLYSAKGGRVPIGNRHGTLFRQGIILRNITPSITIEVLSTILYCLYKFHYQHSHDFGVYEVCRISHGVMKLNHDDEKFKNTGRRKYIFNRNIYSSIDISKEDKIKELAKCKRRKRDTFLQKNYDWNKSVLDNAKLLNLSKSTFYNYLKENNHCLNRDNKYSEFLELYNQNLEIRSVRKLAKLTGLSDKTVQKYKKRIENER